MISVSGASLMNERIPFYCIVYVASNNHWATTYYRSPYPAGSTLEQRQDFILDPSRQGLTAVCSVCQCKFPPKCKPAINQRSLNELMRSWTGTPAGIALKTGHRMAYREPEAILSVLQRQAEAGNFDVGIQVRWHSNQGIRNQLRRCREKGYAGRRGRRFRHRL